MEFMAIEVLLGYSHTYRHDLESFFYVLIWICARRAWEREFQCRAIDRPPQNILKKWYMGDYDDIAQAKRGYMHADGFEDILEEFPGSANCVKPLCRRIRRILFRLTADGKLDIRTHQIQRSYTIPSFRRLMTLSLKKELGRCEPLPTLNFR